MPQLETLAPAVKSNLNIAEDALPGRRAAKISTVTEQRMTDADLSSCDREPIHIPNLIQPFGALLAMRPRDLLVTQASANLGQVLGIAASEAVGRPLAQLLGEQTSRRIALALEQGELHSISPATISIPGTGRECYMYYNSTEDALIAEFELLQDNEEPPAGNMLSLPQGELPFGAIHDCRTPVQLGQLLAREMRRLTGFDRAIVYRFDEDWHGVVIAEDRNGVYAHSFLGHHFPASDIPAHARKLFTLNRFRVIPDVSYVPVPLVPETNPGTGTPLDMTFCTLRNVAEVHREYLANMDVQASLTVSLLNGDRLWGMITCHSAKPRRIPIGVRVRCKTLAEVGSYAVAGIERSAHAEQKEIRQQELRKVQERLLTAGSIEEAVNEAAPHILKALAADALLLQIDGRMIELGMAVPQAAGELIKAALEQDLRGNMTYSRNLADLDPRLASFANMASGALYCRLNTQGAYYIALRREIVESRHWAGNPHKPVDLPGTGRIHPRKSFELWQEAVRGHSLRWQTPDLDAAWELRRLLLERSEQLARKQFEGAWRSERDRSSDILEAMGEGFLLLDKDFRILRINSEGLKLAEKQADAILGRNFWEVWPEAFEAESGRAYRRAMFERVPVTIEKSIRRDNGERIWMDIRAYPFTDGLAILFSDASQRKAMEDELRRVNETLEERVAVRSAQLEQAHAQLHQSQKMEALGQLTGGIAHDFNNLLATIISSLDIMRLRLQQHQHGDLPRYIDGASGAAERAAALTHRLLSFARQQTLEAKAVDMNKLVSGMSDLIQRAVGPAIRIDFLLAPDLWPTHCDAHQLENALLNLAINGRDAMPAGGTLSIMTRNVCIDGGEEAGMDLAPGDYVTISVSDTGTGMPPEVAERAFDPFFTTKPMGKGTGLGLSMIYGFARQSGGQARIFTRPGQGTTVRLYFPRHTGEVDHTRHTRPRLDTFRPARETTVLLVEDELELRTLLGEMLRELGYDTVERQDADGALDALHSSTRFDLLISDIGLPGRMNGRRLAALALEMHPALKVLLISGLGNQPPSPADELPSSIPVLTKPVAIESFAARVADLLHQRH